MLTPWSALGQPGGGENAASAKAPTAEEFVDFLRDVRAVLSAHFPQPLYVFDNPWFHVGKTARKLMTKEGFTDKDLLKIPPYSPEFNKVVEHSHARLVPEVELGVSANPYAWCFDEVCQIISEAFHKVNSPDVVRRDTLSLKKTYSAVVVAQGGHIKHSLR